MPFVAGTGRRGGSRVSSHTLTPSYSQRLKVCSVFFSLSLSRCPLKTPCGKANVRRVFKARGVNYSEEFIAARLFFVCVRAYSGFRGSKCVLSAKHPETRPETSSGVMCRRLIECGRQMGIAKQILRTRSGISVCHIKMIQNTRRNFKQNTKLSLKSIGNLKKLRHAVGVLFKSSNRFTFCFS